MFRGKYSDKKVIWDLDGTLLSADYSKEDDFLRSQIKDEKVEEFIRNKVKYLIEYESSFFKYDIELFSTFYHKVVELK